MKRSQSRRAFVSALGSGALVASAAPVIANARVLGAEIAAANAGTDLSIAGGVVLTAAIKRRLQIIRTNEQQQRVLGSDPTTDAAIRISQNAINKLLNAHYNKNPMFYIRDREHGKPIFEGNFNDHGTIRTIKFYAKVVPGTAEAPVAIDLQPGPASRQRYETWAASRYSSSALADATLAPNVQLVAPNVILQIDFPSLTSPTPHQLDIAFRIVAGATLQVVENMDGSRSLQLKNFDIQLSAVTDPSIPGDGPVPTDCQAIVDGLRGLLRDALIIGGNVALMQLASNLVETLPLPPIDVVQGVLLYPRIVRIVNRTIELDATMTTPAIAAKVPAAVNAEMQRFYEDLGPNKDLAEVISDALSQAHNSGVQLTRPALATHLENTIPAFRNLNQRFDRLNTVPAAALTPHAGTSSRQAVEARDLVVELSGQLVDSVARKLLQADQNDCTRWYHTPELPPIPFLQGRACYIFQLTNAKGGINGATLRMGCDVFAGGYLQIQVCEWNPCGAPACTPPFSVGLALAGPLGLNVTVSSTWIDNTALSLNAHFTSFPGFAVIGLPPGVSEIVNLLLEILTGVLLKTFFNAILSIINQLPLIHIAKEVPKANLSVAVSDFASSNDGNLLAIGGTLTFS